MSWTVTVLPEARAELDALSDDLVAKFTRVVRLIENNGLERVHEPHVKHLEGRLWEMRLIGRNGIARAVYVTTTGRRVVVVRVFVKKTQKTPARELEIARNRAKEVV